jgi:hypothetical protein
MYTWSYVNKIIQTNIVSWEIIVTMSLAHLFSFLCFVFLICFCVLCSMLPVSLDCPFLITSSVFSNVYSPTWIIQFNSWVHRDGISRCLTDPLNIVRSYCFIRDSALIYFIGALFFLFIDVMIVHSWLPLRFSLTFIHQHELSSLIAGYTAMVFFPRLIYLIKISVIKVIICCFL